MKTKAHLVIPHDILEEVDQIAGKRRRSSFIAEATREKLQRERFVGDKRQSYRKKLKKISTS